MYDKPKDHALFEFWTQIYVTSILEQFCNNLLPVGMIRGLKLGLKWFDSGRSERFRRCFNMTDAAAAAAAPLVAIFILFFLLQFSKANEFVYFAIQWNLILRFFVAY